MLCLLALLAVFLLSGQANAAEVELEGTVISQSAEIRNDTAYIPLRHLPGMGDPWEISWDSAARTASAASPQFTLSFPIGTPALLLNDAPYDAPASYIKDGMSYVPLRAAAQLCGFSVTWQGQDQPILLSPAARSHSEDDLYWLSRIISAESRGESLLGQLAVGTVVLNRVSSEEFPDTIEQVVFDEKNGIQFEPVSNGTVYDMPTDSSLLAAQLCLSGTRVAGESLYFYAPALSQGLWIKENRPYFTTIGCHRFFL